VVNSFVALNDISHAIEFGCGDGNQLSLLSIPHYTGVDVSATILERCRTRFPSVGDTVDGRLRANHTFADYGELADVPAAGLGLSLDVLFHLIEDPVFDDYMHTLFRFSTDYVIIYSSDCDRRSPDQHVRHRLVSAYVRRMFPDWSLLARIPNRFPFDPARPSDTSFADFMVFGRGLRGCRLHIPAGDA
jgi:hypothetical protein